MYTQCIRHEYVFAFLHDGVPILFVVQDGYVEAELMDGRRGLVPVVLIQKLSGDELLEFNQRVLTGMKECDDSASTTIPQDLEHLHHSGINCSLIL